MEKIAIVTVDFNGHDDTVGLLNSSKILNTKGFEVKWFLVDNGSDSYLGNYIPKNFSDFEIIQTGENKGFAGGYNHGISYANAWGADYIFAINNDTLIGDPEILQKLVKTLKDNTNLVLASPKILFAPGYEFHKNRYKKSEVGKVIWYGGGYLDWDNVFGKNRGVDEVDGGQYDTLENTDFVSGCCFMASSKNLGKTGLFNEKLFAYFEDVDLMIRAKKLGLELAYNGKTYIYHKVSRTSGIGSPLTDYLITRNRLFVGFKYASLRTRFSLWKESVRFLISGRIAQKQGVMDFFLGKFDGNNLTNFSVQPDSYPLFKYSKELSIVTVNFKTYELTLKLLESITKKNSGFDELKHEIVVLDNGSDDGIGNEIKKTYSQVKFVQSSENLGFSKGNNKAISYTLGEYILLLNSDIEVKTDAIKKILTFAKEKKGNAVVSGKLILDDGSTQKSVFKLPTIAGALKEYFLGIKGEYAQYTPSQSKPSVVEGAVMACYLIPRKILNKIGILSEESFLYFEDIEYARRLAKGNINIYYLPEAEFLHHHGASSKMLGQKVAATLNRKGMKIYHGTFKYLTLELILFLGQKFQRVLKLVKYH